MSKEDAHNFRYDETGTCEDCKHLEWKPIDYNGVKFMDSICNLYDFSIQSPVSFYKCNSWEWET